MKYWLDRFDGQKTKIFGSLLLVSFELQKLWPGWKYWPVVQTLFGLGTAGGGFHAFLKGVPDFLLPPVLRTGDGMVPRGEIKTAEPASASKKE